MRATFVPLWLLCGTMDAIYATLVAVGRGGTAAQTWLFVASGPFGDGANSWGSLGIAAGILVHFAIMAGLVGGGLLVARRSQIGTLAPWMAGALYGLITYGFMYGIVLQGRFGLPFPDPDKVKVALGLLPHIFLLGIPIFALERRVMNTSPAS